MAATTTTTGDRLREIRQRRGLSQNALAVKAELHPSSVSRIECGRHEPTLETLRALAAVLRVKLDALAG